NRELSQARAEEVRRLLVERYGIAGERLRAVGYGEDRPLAPNDTAEGRRRNRRVEIHFAWPPAEGGDGG
ncbi:MAG TPA: OmpA family protein, partial [Rhodospirillales bacterium]|nr:OmpA family protein [Rhodospirillales bacterium]